MEDYNMKTTTTVSMEVEDFQFVKGRGLNNSHLLRKAINDLRQGTTQEELLRKINKLANLLEKARNFIEIRGMRMEFEKLLVEQ